MTLEIQCSCGAVKMTLTGAPLAQFYCHCDDCQVVHGAAYVPVALYRAEQTKLVAGTPTEWRRKTTTRATCGECGTRIYAEPQGLGVRSVVAYLLPPSSFRPEFHMQCRHALLPVRDELPHYAGFAPLFGGSDERVEWVESASHAER